MHAPEPTAIELSFERGADRLRVRVVEGIPRGPVFRRWRRCAVSYEGQVAVVDGAARAQIAAILENAGARADRHLERAPLAELLRKRDRRTLDASPEAVAGWLGVAPGERLLGRFEITAIHAEPAGVRIDLTGPDGGRSLRLTQPPLRDTLQVEIEGEPSPAGALLTLRTTLQVHARRSPIRLSPSPAAPAGERELKLQINAPCHQACEFCSIPRDRVPQVQLGDLLNTMTLARGRGARALRLTGIDPLAFGGILEVVRGATRLGFTDIEVHSPSTRLSDEAFCRQIVEAMPPNRRFHVPLFGGDAAGHDAVSGAPGAFVRVMAALDHLARLAGRENVSVHTVLTRNVLPSLRAIVELAAARGLKLVLDLPFPDTEAPSDRFHAVAATQTEVVAALLSTPLGVKDLARVSGLAPCVLHAGLARVSPARAGELRGLAAGGAMRPPPTGIRTPMIACTHRDHCGWIPACSGEVLRSYVALHGDGELVPLAADVRPPG